MHHNKGSTDPGIIAQHQRFLYFLLICIPSVLSQELPLYHTL